MNCDSHIQTFSDVFKRSDFQFASFCTPSRYGNTLADPNLHWDERFMDELLIKVCKRLNCSQIL